MDEIYLALAFGILGLIFGSFLNVVIYRLPIGRSIVSPGSSCPSCGVSLGPIENIPVVSWLALRGRCCHCQAPISIRYPAVEALTGALWAVAAWRFGLTLDGVSAIVLLTVLVAITFIDIDHKIIPNKIVLPMMPIAAFLVLLKGQGPAVAGLIGFVVGGGLLLAMAMAYPSGMGGGDIKLTALMGIFLGYHVLTALFIAFVIGGIAGAILWFKRRRDGTNVMKMEIPFGPYLAVGGAAALLFGADILKWYSEASGLTWISG